MKLARWIFGVAGVYGLVLLVPFYFLEDRIGQETPPAITHPEFFYGFVGLGVAWQIAFVCLAVDPVRYRLMMIPSMVEKFAFAIAVGVLFLKDRVPARLVGFGGVDLVFGILFCVAYLRTAAPRQESV
jgi:hypothetical protein